MERIKVGVSPFYGGESWKDEATQILFEKSPRGLNVYSIPTHMDLSGIQKAIRLNALFLIEGDIGVYNEVEEVVVEAPRQEEVKVEEPKQEEAKEEPKAEEPKEEEAVFETKEEPVAPKKPARKKAAPKK